MTDFSTVYNRRNTGNIKWGNTPEDTMAMSVAEMEYALPDNVTKRLSERTAWPFYGYDRVPEGLESSIVNHYRERFGVILEPEWVVIITSVMPGLNMACRMAKGKILYNIPMYSHIRVLSQETKIEAIEVPMLVDKDNRYHMNFEEMEKQVTPEVSTFILCNPHNPVGRSYTKEEIEMVAQFCGKHDLLLLSDEIHCELTFDNIHNPCFSISETSREISITFNSAGKILNIPGIPGAIAIIPNKELRERFTEYTAGVFSQPNAFAMEALKLNYDGSCEDWKISLREQLRSNRDYLESRIAKIKGVRVTHCEATYLAWLDCTRLGLENPSKYFLEEAKLAFVDGIHFGDRQFVRINYAVPRSQLEEALDRLERAINKAYREAWIK